MRSTKAGALIVSESVVWAEGRAISIQRQINGKIERGPTGTVSHVVQSFDSDSDAFILVIETAVHGHPSGWGGKKTKEFISSLKHWSANKHVKSLITTTETNKCQ